MPLSRLDVTLCQRPLICCEPMPNLCLSHISELSDHVGESLGCSQWIQIDQSRIDAFAEATGDRQWIHVDTERAKKESPFGDTIAHGYLTLAVVPSLLDELIEVKGCSRIVNYGLDKLRLKEAVRSGSRIRINAQILSVRFFGGGDARVTFKVKWEIEGCERPACLAEAVLIYYR